MPTFTLEEQLRGVEREIGLRESVYPRRVAAGKMTQSKADREIALMRAIADTVRAAMKTTMLDV